ncbi:MAG TPA: serine/threonine-protein kinase, partial [Gemmatales bacterium]|nr:serine/threonine-protein kinase [Gemmatales bacterium]
MTPESLFHAALAKSDPIERSGFLDEACGTDQKLRQEIEALLQAHAGCGEFMGKPAVEQTAAFDPDNTTGFSLQTIDQIGPYKLREKLGEGGMGTVYVADQKEPVQRRVAIKLIKGGSDSKGLLARFEQERQALALMDHPNIAKVFDAGVFERTPYFVMELIKGVRITKYCDDARLSPKQRLELFIPVCQAVQHAHQKGIIHRDLKPSNILIGLYDGKPIPKIIDFGVAKATGSRLTDQSIYTEVGSLVGTLEYMSPEQAELNNLDIDTRSDIYALGVILYELLTGSVPFSRKDLAAAGFGEMLRVIKEVEPTKPSTKLSGSGTLPSIAASRQTEPAKLSSIVRGELDWIVMKCLEKDRGRRYETANQLGMEIQRYLADEPVLAGPPSAGYRLRKFVARNKGKVIAAGLVFLTLVAGIAGTSWGLYREAQRAEGERLAKLDAEKAAAAERVANEQTQKRLKQIEKGNAVLTAVFDDLNIIYVKEGKEPLEAVLAKRLVKAGGQLEGDSVGDPLVVASLQFR